MRQRLSNLRFSLIVPSAKAISTVPDFALPGFHRHMRPAWSDENLCSVFAQVRSHFHEMMLP